MTIAGRWGTHTVPGPSGCRRMHRDAWLNAVRSCPLGATTFGLWGSQTLRGPFGSCRTQPRIWVAPNGAGSFSLRANVTAPVDREVAVKTANANAIANAAAIETANAAARIVRCGDTDTGGRLVFMAELPVVGNAAGRRSIKCNPKVLFAVLSRKRNSRPITVAPLAADSRV